MPVNRKAQQTTFGLLPEPDRRPGSFFTSIVINGLILGLAIYVGATAKQKIEEHVEQMVLIIPSEPPPPPPEKVKLPDPPKIPDAPKMPEVKLEEPKIFVPKPEPKPDMKPIQMEAKVVMPVIKAPKFSVVEAPQPKAVLSSAMPAQVPQTRVSTVPVHLGQTFGVTPNPNATRPATVAAIGNPSGNQTGYAVAPHGVVGSTGIGNGIKQSQSSAVIGKVIAAGVPGASTTASQGSLGRVQSAGIPVATAAVAVPQMVVAQTSTNLEVLSKPPVQYPAEAKNLRVQGDVILRVTFTASGQVVVQSVVHSLGHGLDEEARRVAQQIRFRPATRNGQPVDQTTNITISFQLA